MIGSARYPLDTWTKNTFLKEYQLAGGLYRPVGTPRERYRVKLIEDQLLEEAITPFHRRQEDEQMEQLFKAQTAKAARKEAKERAVTAVYREIEKNRIAAAEVLTTPPPDDTDLPF